MVATRQRWPAFAVQVAAAARAAGFQAAARKAFMADGSANAWRVQQRFFGSFVPILDFIHALSDGFAAATADRPFAVGWTVYREWIAWVWQGEVERVIAALAERPHELGPPRATDPETHPRRVVAEAATYFGNQRERMRYAEYRRQGLPLTSSRMESAVKQINQRVKGTEKFGTEAGAEALLQLRADEWSDGAPLEAFGQRRQATATGQRPYRRAS